MKSDFLKKASALRRKEAEKSIHAFALTYLPHYLEYPPSSAHIEIYEELTLMVHERGRKFGVAAPIDSMLFTELHGQWEFKALEANACKVMLHLRYQMATPLLATAVGPVFGLIAATLVERFVARADAMYDNSARV